MASAIASPGHRYSAQEIAVTVVVIQSSRKQQHLPNISGSTFDESAGLSNRTLSWRPFQIEEQGS